MTKTVTISEADAQFCVGMLRGAMTYGPDCDKVWRRIKTAIDSSAEHTDAPCFFEFSKNEFDEAAFRRFCQAAGWPPEKVEEHVTRMKEAVAGYDPNGPLHAVLAAGFKRFEIATSPIFGSSAEPEVPQFTEDQLRAIASMAEFLSGDRDENGANARLVFDRANQLAFPENRQPVPNIESKGVAEPAAPRADQWTAEQMQRLAQANVARGFCQLSRIPACSEYPNCQCGRSAQNRTGES